MSRGLNALKGTTIKKVDSSCVNQVVLELEDGRVITLYSDLECLGPGSLSMCVIRAKTEKRKKETVFAGGGVKPGDWKNVGKKKKVKPKFHDYD